MINMFQLLHDGRISEDGGSEIKPIWTCKQCRTSMFGHLEECTKCHTTKPDLRFVQVWNVPPDVAKKTLQWHLGFQHFVGFHKFARFASFVFVLLRSRVLNGNFIKFLRCLAFADLFSLVGLVLVPCASKMKGFRKRLGAHLQSSHLWAPNW